MHAYRSVCGCVIQLKFMLKTVMMKYREVRHAENQTKGLIFLPKKINVQIKGY